MYPAIPSPGKPELPWQRHTPPLLLLCFQPSTSAYYSDSDTKRHEERGPGVNKQRMPLHVTPAWTDALAGNWRSWKDGWKEQTHTYAWIHYTHTHKGMSEVIAFHLSMACLGQAIAFSCPVLNTEGEQGYIFSWAHSHFQLRPLQSSSFRIQCGLERRRMQHIDWQVGKPLIVI